VFIGLLACVAASCGEPAEQTTDETGMSTTTSLATGTSEPTTSTSTEQPGTTGPGETSTSSSSGEPTSGGTTNGETTAGESTGEESTTGPVGCTRNVVVMGYWPPTNEMLRPWSMNAEQNPDGWIGEDWEGYGYDVYSFFPEFPPDGDPTNDDIGDPGAVGSPDFDLQVDYQATSADFWRIVDTYQPVILVTTSRGGEIGWEIEAIEGGHGMMNNMGPAMDWTSDGYMADKYPTQETIEAASWDAISTYRKGNTLASQLPLDEIFALTSELGVTTVEIEQGTSGNFLSGFLGLHGVYYNQLAPQNVAAGHIHVGYGLPVEDASMLIEETLRAVISVHPADSAPCP
jgi:hypothetical protein